MTWEEKAEWLRKEGYHLIIEETGGGIEPEQGWYWCASINGEGRRYAKTIGEAVEQVYEWITYQEPKVKNPDLSLNVGDFFHVEVVETDEITELNKTKFPEYKLKLAVMDGPKRGSYLYFDTRINPHLVE